MSSTLCILALGGMTSIFGGNDTGYRTIRELRESPSGFVNSEITVRGVFHGFDDRVAPLATEFTKDRFQNFAAWDFDQAIWRGRAYADSSPIFFAPLGSQVLYELHTLAKYEFIEVRGIVRSDYGKEPWIEVLAIERLDEAYPESALRALRQSELYRGRDMAAKALTVIEPIEESDLPDGLRFAVHEERGHVMMETGRYAKAAKEFRQAASLREDAEPRLAALVKRAEELERAMGLPAVVENRPVTPESSTGSGSKSAPRVGQAPGSGGK